MDNYGQYNEPFSTNEDLYTMAKDFNNKKKINKQLHNDINTRAMSTCVGMDCMLDPANSRFAPSSIGLNLGSDFNYEESQGQFDLGLPTPIYNQIKKKSKKSEEYNDINLNSDMSNSTDSAFTASTQDDSFIDLPFKKQDKIKHYKKSAHVKNFESDFSDSSLDQMFDPSYMSQISDISSFSSLPQKIKKKIRNESPHLAKYKDKDEKDVFGHILNCTECKNQLAGLLKTVVSQDENNVCKNTSSNVNQINNQKTIHYNDSQIFGMNTFELKDMLILLLIGIFIIIFIDMFVRR